MSLKTCWWDQRHELDGNVVINLDHREHENNIEVVLFSFPYNSIMLDNTDPNQIENFEKMLKNKQKQFDVNLFFLHDKYSNLNIWKDTLHMANNPKTIIFTEDILEKIIEVID